MRQTDAEVTANVSKYKNTILAMTDKLKADLSNMLDEHKRMVSALEKLINAANQENKPEYNLVTIRVFYGSSFCRKV
jgi:hypothetical protein